MKAIAYHKFGSTDVLQTVEEQKPAITANQVLVKIKAVSINPMDWKIRKGEMTLMSGSKFPKHTGMEFAGVIEETGSTVSDFKNGDEVFGVVKDTMKEGALAEYIAIAPKSIWKKPREINFFQSATLPIAGAAAVTVLEKMGNIKPGTQVLINGATGGLGMFLLQLLKHKNANVTAVANSASIATAIKWGADSVVDYTTEDVLTSKKTYDIVIDLSAKMGYQKARKIMKSRSMFINPTPKPIEIPLSFIKNLFTGKKHNIILSQPSSDNIAGLIKAIQSGLQIEINKIFPFSATIEAYQHAEKGGVSGKVVIDI